MTYEQFKTSYDSDQLAVGIDPADARKFYMNSSRRTIEDLIGESMLGQYFSVNFLYWLHWLILTVSLFFLCIEIKWWSLLVVPFVFLLYIIFGSRASFGNQSLRNRVKVFLTCLVVGYIWFQNLDGIRYFIYMFPFALLLLKSTYVVATNHMRALIIDNPIMYEMATEAGILRVREHISGMTYFGPNLGHQRYSK
ncbi:hypothetical protein J2T17_006309 [Paenibacillus mucilaginosus]|uniref:hypothetical protein n=1 Tax=Paenibacillus mucilaginosus TaxID=61624 RepID=UPI003D1B8113